MKHRRQASKLRCAHPLRHLCEWCLQATAALEAAADLVAGAARQSEALKLVVGHAETSLLSASSSELLALHRRSGSGRLSSGAALWRTHTRPSHDNLSTWQCRRKAWPADLPAHERHQHFMRKLYGTACFNLKRTQHIGDNGPSWTTFKNKLHDN